MTNDNRSSTSRISVVKPSLPKGGGDNKGVGETFSPHEFSGAMGLNIPLPATPYRNKAIGVSLDYNSGSGNSLFGLGWELSLPEIVRQTSKRIPTYDDRDTFLYTGDDYLVPVLDINGNIVTTIKQVGSASYTVNRFVSRTVNNLDRIERYTNEQDASDIFWIITSTENTISLFGKTKAARVFNPDEPAQIFKWLLEERYDTRGDHQVFSYRREDGMGITNGQLTQNRDISTQCYPWKIFYGNYTSIPGSILLQGINLTTISWHFEVAFDYGQYGGLPAAGTSFNTTPEGQWDCRLDPYSDYFAGFEIRSYRLCRNILVFHRFPGKEYGTDNNVLVNALSLSYDSTPGLSLLSNITLSGYTYIAATESYEVASLPSMRFTYSAFQPATRNYIPNDFRTFVDENEKELTGILNAPDYQLVDLYGSGIPGILFTNENMQRYQFPNYSDESGIHYYRAKDIRLPGADRWNMPSHILTDITGDGQPDLLVTQPPLSGFYASTEKNEWKTLQSFKSFPSIYAAGVFQHVDTTGNGLADLLFIQEEAIIIHYSSGSEGYTGAVYCERPGDFPVLMEDTDEAMFRFADVCGTGLSQLVCIRDGEITCWPNLGYGKFGQPVRLANVPNFGIDFDITRVRLAAVSGSGLADFIYLYHDEIAVYVNDNGNGFAKSPVHIPLPEFWSISDQVQFEDVLGSGSLCLVFSTANPVQRQWYYDFNQTTWIDAAGLTSTVTLKPRLLIGVDNNMGARTIIRYTSSTRFYLDDLRNNNPWLTRLPFPVQVIENISTIDDIAKNWTSSSFSYHHGYYDGVEREFRGFGRVERTDVKNFEAYVPSDKKDDAAFHPPPVLTKTWYHTGAWLQEQELLLAYSHEYWKGDIYAPAIVPADFLLLNADTFFRELVQNGIIDDAGKIILLPVAGAVPVDSVFTMYAEALVDFILTNGIGKIIKPADIAAALTIPEHTKPGAIRNAHRTLYGSVIRSELYGKDATTWQDNPYSVNQGRFQVRQQQLTGNNSYPVFQIHQRESFVMEYERNQLDPSINHSLILALDQFGHVLQSASVCYGRRNTQVPAGIDPQTSTQQQLLRVLFKQYNIFNQFSHTDSGYLLGITLQEKQSEITNMSPASVYFTVSEIVSKLPSATKKMLWWERNYFFDPEKQVELPLGNVTAELLLHRTECITFEKAGLASLFEPVLTGEALLNILNTGGYIDIDPSDPDYSTASLYNWDPGESQAYAPVASFCVPTDHFDPFQYVYIRHGVTTPESTPRIRFEYDEYFLQTKSVTDPLQNVVSITGIDYQRMTVVQMKNSNETTEEVLLDPLGRVMVTSYYGMENDAPVGFGPVANYKAVANPLVSDMLGDDELSAGFLQSAASYFFYDFFSWQQKRIPVRYVQLVAEQYPVADKQTGPIEKSIQYADGFGRTLQSKSLTGIDTIKPWSASGLVLYNEKGQPVKKYEPFFSPDYEYIDNEQLNKAGVSDTLFYDAVGRVVMTVSADGFISKTLMGDYGTDPNITYKGYLNKKLYGGLKQSFVPSPWCSLMFDKNDTILDADYIPPGNADVNAAAVAEAALCFDTPIRTYFDSMMRSIETGQLNVTDQERCATYTLLDFSGNALAAADQRLHVNGYSNFKTSYNLKNQPVYSFSADNNSSGNWGLQNVVGLLLWNCDSRGTVTTQQYDIIHRPAFKHVFNNGTKDPKLVLNQVVELYIYGDSEISPGVPFFSHPGKRNLKGMPCIVFDQGGLAITPFYTIQGDAAASATILTTEYKDEVNWDSINQASIETIATVVAGISSPADLYSLDPATLKLAGLEDDLYVFNRTFDAVGNLLTAMDPDKNNATNHYYLNRSLKASLITAISKKAAIGQTKDINLTPSVVSIIYDAKGQRLSSTAGNGVATYYTYDPDNFRLRKVKSIRASDAVVLQDLDYHHDPVGNVTSITDNSIPTVFFRNQKVDALCVYTYDRLYRLTKATGREHTGMYQNYQQSQNNIRNLPGIPTSSDPITNGKALRNYSHSFSYDAGNNLLAITRSAGTNNLNRTFNVMDNSNLISASALGSFTTNFSYDANGNQQNSDGLNALLWNYRNNLRQVIIIPREGSTADAEYYIYDQSGNRARKVRETKTESTIKVDETIYLGNFEIRRKATRALAGKINIKEEWHWLYAAGCRWGYLTAGKNNYDGDGYQLRYQLTNAIGSSCMELNNTGQVISYEEYYPYGGTSIVAASNAVEVAQRYYRYSGMEEDDATGFYYYGLRYYCPWLARWISPDPAGTIDGMNLFVFVRGNPITSRDIGGMCSDDEDAEEDAAMYDENGDEHEYKNSRSTKRSKKTLVPKAKNEDGSSAQSSKKAKKGSSKNKKPAIKPSELEVPEGVNLRSNERTSSSKFMLTRFLQRFLGGTRNYLTIKMRTLDDQKPIYITMLSLGNGKAGYRYSLNNKKVKKKHTESAAVLILREGKVQLGDKTIHLDPDSVDYITSSNEACASQEQCRLTVVPELVRLAGSPLDFYQGNEYINSSSSGGWRAKTKAHDDKEQMSDEESEEDALFVHVVQPKETELDFTKEKNPPIRVVTMKDYYDSVASESGHITKESWKQGTILPWQRSAYKSKKDYKKKAFFRHMGGK